jgi:hypothetical protein
MTTPRWQPRWQHQMTTPRWQPSSQMTTPDDKPQMTTPRWQLPDDNRPDDPDDNPDDNTRLCCHLRWHTPNFIYLLKTLFTLQLIVKITPKSHETIPLKTRIYYKNVGWTTPPRSRHI